MPLPLPTGARPLGGNENESQATVTADATGREVGGADSREPGYAAWEGYSLDILTALLDD